MVRARHRGRRGFGLASPALVALALGAQEARPDQRKPPEIHRVAAEGVHAVSADDLLQGIATQATRCRSVLLTPICLITKGGVWNQRHYLDHLELRRDVVRIRVYYWKRGYRETQVDTAIAFVDPHHTSVSVTFRITEGPPVIVRTIEIAGTDSLLSRKALGELVLLRPSAPLDLLRLDSTRALVEGALLDQGFADAKVHDTAAVADSQRTAAVLIAAEPGRHATVASVAVTGNKRVSGSTIGHMITIHPGDLFRRSQLLESQRNLYQSQLFRRASIEAAATTDSAKAVTIRVSEAPPRALRGNVGFNTVDFFQLEGHYTDFNWLGNARRLDVQGVLGNLLAGPLNGHFIFRDVLTGTFGAFDEQAFLDPTYQAGVTVTQPYFGSPLNSLGAGIFAHRRSAPGIYIDEGYGGNLSFTRYIRARIPLTISYQYEQTRVNAGDIYFCVNFGVCEGQTIDALRQRNALSPLTATLNIDRANDPFFPSAGYRTRIDLQHASKFTASDFRYNRIFAEQSNYRQWGPGVLALRARAGYVRALANPSLQFGDTVLHPRTRFFAGGSQSVRGYGENQLGPRVLTIDPTVLADSAATGGHPCTNAQILAGGCAAAIAAISSDQFVPRPTGGSALIEGSIEYRLPLYKSLSGAVFVDGAFVGQGGLQNVAKGNGALTPGFGVRYASSVGPIRVDLGIRPTLVEHLPVLTEVVNPDLSTRIVTLTDENGRAVEKIYDPLEGRNGFQRLLARLTLHLSIGQAF